jgi:hypothetical protein
MRCVIAVDGSARPSTPSTPVQAAQALKGAPSPGTRFGPSASIDRWIAHAENINRIARLLALPNTSFGESNTSFEESRCEGTPMNQPDSEFDYPRYRKLLAEAVDERRRLALINLLIDERARDKLATQATQQKSDVIRGMIAPRDAPDARRK